MAFSDFTFPQVLHDLKLELQSDDFASEIPSANVDPLLKQFLDRYVPLALSSNTEKARSEFAIAPILAEVKRLAEVEIALFSGVAFDVDRDRGLSGILDFALAKTSNPYVLSAPILVVVAKNDNLASGLGEVISAMRAADFSNRISNITTTVYGLCTTGTEWRFMKCNSKVVTLNCYDFYIDNVGKILGVLQHVVRSS